MAKLGGTGEINPRTAGLIILLMAFIVIGVFWWRVKVAETPPPSPFGTQQKLPFPDTAPAMPAGQ